MFDIGFWELSVIGVIALLVVGPERLPAMARTLGLWVGRLRRYVSHVRDDIEREIQAEELRGLMKESRNLNSIGDSLGEAGKVLNEVKSEIESVDRDVSSKRDEADNGQADAKINDPPSAVDSAATDVANAVSGSDARDPAEKSEADGPESSKQTPTNERRSG